MKTFAGVLISFFLVGCATPGASTIESLDIPLVELQKVVEGALPITKRHQSQNNREFLSEYFVVKSGEYEEAPQAAVRNYAHIFILGDRKPYNIEVLVVTEKRVSGGGYIFVKHDQGLARVISRRIQSALHKRRDGRNIIDDFRVF